MKIPLQIVTAILLLIAGFAIGYPVGKSSGFSTGSEWALVQAELLAKEAGVVMPVTYEDGELRVKIKQPGNMYKRAWQMADMRYEEMKKMRLTQYTACETLFGQEPSLAF